ncbi:MAG: hypothetical protein LBG58_01815 [Planctomycetaceae bacterium]|jgi:hypothetical protein|nr:hypothetical protein [Planctomycetaceae bacterium]
MFQNFMTLFCFRCFIVVTLLLFLNGCGKTALPDGMPKPYPVTITITQEGKGLEKVFVILVPNDPALGQWTASGESDSSGKAVIRTLGKYPGVVPGKYNIVLRKREVQARYQNIPDPKVDREGYEKATRLYPIQPKDTWDLIDPKYSDQNTTPETIEVLKKKNNRTIEVGAAVKIKYPDPDEHLWK